MLLAADLHPRFGQPLFDALFGQHFQFLDLPKTLNRLNVEPRAILINALMDVAPAALGR